MKKYSKAFTGFICSTSLVLSGCGTLTGIPGHGGGKRFAIEQELLSSSIKAVARDLPIDSLQGKKVALFFIGIGDQGTGNIVGGRYSVASLLRGGYIATAPTTVTNDFLELDRITNSETSNTTTTGSTSTTANTTTTSNTSDISDAARRSVSEREGGEFTTNIGLEYNGIGNYTNGGINNPGDYKYLSGVIQKELVIRGIDVVEPEQADYDLFVTVDVFGTIRRRHDWHIVNQESLTAKTSIEVAAIERSTGDVVILPQSTSYEAAYNEQYIAWAGPVYTMKELRLSDGILSDNLPIKVEYAKFPLESPVNRTIIAVED